MRIISEDFETRLISMTDNNPMGHNYRRKILIFMTDKNIRKMIISK